MTEVGIEKNSPLFMDELVHAVESVLRGTDCSLLLTFGPAGEPFQQRIRSLSGKVDGLLVAEEVMPPGQLRALAAQHPGGRHRGPPGRDANWTSWRWTTPPACGRWPGT